MKQSLPIRKIEQGEEMPEDFWNYNVNPIVGYYVPTVFSTRRMGSYKQREN